MNLACLILLQPTITRLFTDGIEHLIAESAGKCGLPLFRDLPANPQPQRPRVNAVVKINSKRWFGVKLFHGLIFPPGWSDVCYNANMQHDW